MSIDNEPMMSRERAIELLESIAKGQVGGISHASPIATACQMAVEHYRAVEFFYGHDPMKEKTAFITSTVQGWVHHLPRMQQAVMLTAIRGPDGIEKNHVAKKMCRWLRRSILVAAFDGHVYDVPYDEEGWQSGSFTGPACYRVGTEARPRYVADAGTFSPKTVFYHAWQDAMWEVFRRYVVSTDMMPHHFQLHFMHAAEILGYKHPVYDIREWWNRVYNALANDMHLMPEDEVTMDQRLGDKEKNWRAAEKGMSADV